MAHASMRMFVVVVVTGVLVVVEAQRSVIVGGFFFSGMAVHETVGVAVFVLMQMFVGGFAMSMGMVMQMAVGMVVLVFVLQGLDGQAAALPVGKGQAVEIAQALVLEKNLGRSVIQNAPLVHYQGAAGQFSHEEHIVADQQQGDVELPQDGQQQLLSPRIETGGGLVQDEQLGLHGQHAGQRQAFALASGQVQGNTIFEAFQMDQGQGLFNPLPDF